MSMVMSENPTDAEIVAALGIIRGGGGLTVKDGGCCIWPLAVVRYVNGLGPEPTEPGRIAYERVSAAASMAAAPGA